MTSYSQEARDRIMFFHELNVTDIGSLRKHGGTHFDVGECRGKPAPCVPRYLRRWQASTRTALAGRTLRWHGGTCAVVGSSNSLMKTPRGHLIDAAAAVFRINAAPTRGYEVHVGRRTTLRFYGVQAAPGPTTPVVWGTHPRLPAASEPGTIPVCICPPVKWVDRCWSELSLPLNEGGVDTVNGTRLTPSQRLGATAPRLSPLVKWGLREQLRQASHRKPRYGQHPTTGAMAVHVAVGTCERVALFGFGACGATALARGKYYERHQGRKSYLRNLNAHHDIEAEQAWLRGLVRRGIAIDPEGCLS